MTTATGNLDSIGIRSLAQLRSQDADRTQLGQEDFLELMTTQLQNQDPFKPMENGDFLAQIAQFSTVSGIQDLQSSFESLSQSLVSNQALQASGLVGRTVLVPTGLAALEEGGSIGGLVDVPASSNEVKVTVTDESGQTIRTLSLGGQPAGDARFKWDGIKDDGSFAAPGTYFVSASANYEGNDVALDTQTYAAVDSVTLGNNGGLQLDLRGVGRLDFSHVRQIL